MLQQAFEFMLPESKWVPVASLPDLRHEKEIGVDTETFDPGLTEKGPGYLRETGHVVGISISSGSTTQGGRSFYLPIGHQFGGNMDRGIISDYLRDQLGETDRDVVFANAPYDLGWLRTLGVEVAGRIQDIQIMDPLLDSERPDGYSLDAITHRWLGERKFESMLDQAANAHGLKKAKEGMHLLAPRFVGPYAEKDPEQTLRCYRAIKASKEWQEVAQLYDTVEQPLIRTLFEMTWRGIRVDQNYADALNSRWKKEEEALYQELGFREVWDEKACSRYLKSHGIVLGTSLDKAFLKGNGKEWGLLLRKARELNRCRGTFLEQNLLQGVRNGRIHPQYVQMASDEGGTRSGRLSCKNPNAQQIPKRSQLIDSKSIRKALIPEEGCEWGKWDYWSQEPIIQCHYGLKCKLPGAEEVAAMFAQGKKLAVIIAEKSAGKLNYDEAKEVTLARSYGQQTKGMALKMGMSFDDAEELQGTFDDIVPYIIGLVNGCKARAGSVGYIKTLLGRKQPFNLWQRRFTPKGEDYTEAFSLEMAKKRWPEETLQRAFLYKAFNKLIQGSAADQTKLALVRIHREVGLPQMTVHDEISKSIANRSECPIIKHIMETCIPMLLPARADMDIGPTWQ